MLEGSVIIVTGGASGLGAADAAMLSDAGATVIITDVQEDLGVKLASSLERAEFLSHDVTSEQSWQGVVEAVLRSHGKIDGLVNNAGILRFGDAISSTLDDFRSQLEVMVVGPFLGCKTTIPAMEENGCGTIVNLASTAAIKGIGSIPGYSAAKGGVVALTRSVARYCLDKGNNVRVNCIAPGNHDTPMTRLALSQLSPDDAALDQATMHGQGDPLEVANLVTFLMSDKSKNITGQCITIDRGETV